MTCVTSATWRSRASTDRRPRCCGKSDSKEKRVSTERRRLGVGLDRQRIQRGISPAGVPRRSRCRRARHLEPDPPHTRPPPRERARRLDVGEAKPYGSIRDMVADPAIDALWLTGPNHRRLENIEEIVDAVERGQRDPPGHRLREAAGADGRGSRAHAGAREPRRDRARLPGESAVRAAGRGGLCPGLGARRRDDRPAVSRPRRRGTRRTACALVLARRSAGRRRAERHDVSLGPAGPPPADETRRAARVPAAGTHHGAYREPQVVAAALCRGAQADTWPGGRLRRGSLRRTSRAS